MHDPRIDASVASDRAARLRVAAALAAPLLALAAVPMWGTAGSAFASSAECADGPGPICHAEQNCLSWSLSLIPAFPPTEMLQCTRWEELISYWRYPDDGEGEGGATAEDEPETPEVAEPTTEKG
ncbi:MAG TPA: hypothetical protein VK837_13735 [Longimicrobiales bacterium]|nr:hypothetical protein [Longimicrobiales bacterium]